MRHIVVLVASVASDCSKGESELVDVAGVISNLELVHCVELSFPLRFQLGSLVAS